MRAGASCHICIPMNDFSTVRGQDMVNSIILGQVVTAGTMKCKKKKKNQTTVLVDHNYD